MTGLGALPDPLWPTIALAAVMAFFAVLTIRPPAPVRETYDGVGFPVTWRWTLPVMQGAAAAGLAAGCVLPGFALATNIAVVLYFGVAMVAHIRARRVGRDFWAGCVPMLAFAIAVPILGFR